MNLDELSNIQSQVPFFKKESLRNKNILTSKFTNFIKQVHFSLRIKSNDDSYKMTKIYYLEYLLFNATFQKDYIEVCRIAFLLYQMNKEINKND